MLWFNLASPKDQADKGQAFEPTVLPGDPEYKVQNFSIERDHGDLIA